MARVPTRSPRASSASTSASVGIDGAVPGRVTEIPATAQPNRTAAAGSIPRASPVAKPPLKASPAPVVSTTGPATTAGTSSERPCPCSSAPFAPSVITTVPTPRSRSRSAAARAASTSPTGIPVSSSASVSFGVR